MEFYYLIWFILFVFTFFEISGLKYKQDIVIFFSFSFFFFVLSFIRWETGTDWEGYYTYFNVLTTLFQESDFEWGFSRINELVKIIFNSYTVLLFIFSSIIYYLQTKTIYNLSPYKLFSLFFLWSIFFANVFYIRQTIAIVILLYSLKYIQHKKFFYFFLCVLIASQFHRVAFVFIPAYFLYHMKLSVKKMLIFLAISVSFSGLISVLFSSYSNLFGPIIQNKLEVYLALGEDKDTMTETSFAALLLRGVANKLFVFVLLVLALKLNIEDMKKYIGLLNIYWFGIILYFSTVSVSIVFVRFSFPYDMIQIFLIPMALYSIKNEMNRRILFLLFSLFLLLRFYVTLHGSYYDLYVPYRTIFH